MHLNNILFGKQKKTQKDYCQTCPVAIAKQKVPLKPKKAMNYGATIHNITNKPFPTTWG